jgi:pimeloyl-ACP methyl ester carboxylesterase
MEPRIQYAKTADGVSIAFWTLGQGMPFVQVPLSPWSHIQLDWLDPGSRRWWEQSAEKVKLVRYDGRGTGLSDRNVADYSVEAHMLDLQAVVECLGLQRFALGCSAGGASLAIPYAVRHPEAVSHLVLWCPWWLDPRGQAFWALLEGGDWELFTEAVANAVFGWAAGEEAQRIAAFLRECTTPEAVRAIYDAAPRSDVAAALQPVRAPTLILQRRQVTAIPGGVEVAKRLASRLPNARLVLLEGTSLMPWVGDEEAVRAVIDEFLGLGEAA